MKRSIVSILLILLVSITFKGNSQITNKTIIALHIISTNKADAIVARAIIYHKLKELVYLKNISFIDKNIPEQKWDMMVYIDIQNVDKNLIILCVSLFNKLPKWAFAEDAKETFSKHSFVHLNYEGGRLHYFTTDSDFLPDKYRIIADTMYRILNDLL